jgi:predicted small lipoprotein YifL
VVIVGHVLIAIAVLATTVTGCGLVNPRPLPLAQTCAEWSRLNADQRLQPAEAVIAPELVSSVRERQHLPPEATDAEVFAAVGGSFTKVCELERQPALRLTEIVTSLYRQGERAEGVLDSPTPGRLAV